MKLSKYNVIRKIEGKGYLIYNLLHQNLLYVKKEDYKDFCDASSNNPYYEIWKKEMIIVDNNIDEYQNKLSRINTNSDFQYITIFTTTACNARCSYCFESGIETLAMKDKDLDKIGEAIIKQIKTKRFHVTWFGGEPLLIPNVIDRLSEKFIKYCDDNDIKYTSTIITNGSLINDDIIEKITNKWRTAAVQISLDGTKNIYNLIKNYKDKSNFDKVIANIKNLNFLRKTTIRINFNDSNLDDCLELVKYLYDNDLKNDKVFIYFHPITGEGDKDTEKLTNQYKRIFDTLYKYEYITSVSYFNMHFAVNHCQAENDLSYCVFPNGNVAKCQRERPELSKFSVYDEDFLEKLNYNWKNEHFIEEETTHCQNCISYPLCKGGCKMHDLSKLTKMHCDRCYIYHGCYEAILDCLSKIYKNSFK